ncbi:hypothetical protein A2866_02545 [Candidatus Roizmanbacteria bacterium RIFCSPHIGHO2_01_FULL_39_8]|uniref:HTH arsR-type domain-containing protein n=1 Tax=Candidatus Roizmanbacteria bacterium RIFCSPHIGHO2_01_FULL_39_8 TaxID=1802033 RepID=A0A1F7GJ74_9BACT|nr:MAG: hypothetical protein A2866_02545 [Candidatus Roizmanbacteria bacterium RIFCSPHIGHO2_01_FULL_39_8]
MIPKSKEDLLEEILTIIRKNPGIRPSELNQLLGIPHTWPLRKELIKRGLIRKEKRGSAVYYYSQKS